MPVSKFYSWRNTFLSFPLLAMLGCWPHFGGHKLRVLVLNVESTFRQDVECVEVTERCLESDFFEWGKDKPEEGRGH